MCVLLCYHGCVAGVHASFRQQGSAHFPLWAERNHIRSPDKAIHLPSVSQQDHGKMYNTDSVILHRQLHSELFAMKDSVEGLSSCFINNVRSYYNNHIICCE